MRPSFSGTRTSDALGGFGRLADGFRHFARLAMAETDAALLIAHDDQRGETEAPAALHHLGDTVDVHQLVDEFVVAVFAIAAALPARRHAPSSCLLHVPSCHDP